MAIREPASAIAKKRPAESAPRPRAEAGKGHRIDFATVIGLCGALFLVGGAIVLGGSPSAFLDGPAFLIVIGGTFCVTTICFSIKEMVGAQHIVIKTLFHSAENPREAATYVLRLAETARKGGTLALQSVLDSGRHSPFLRMAITLVVDGSPGEEVERILDKEIAAMRARHAKGAGVLRKAAEISPAMGLIGTLVGLVQMLGNLDDPSTVGPSMAVALLTTFYGAALATMVFSPLASKLDRNSSEELLLDKVYMMAATSISRQENPRRLEMLLNTVLPPAQRVRHFD